MENNNIYYRDAAGRTFRVVRELWAGCYVVVKIFDGSTRTVKLWSGDLSTTEKHWTTKRFVPTDSAKHCLDIDFLCTLQEFGPAFQTLLSLV